MVINQDNYRKALRAAKKEYQARKTRGENPTLEVLEDILPKGEALTQVSLGLINIPIDQIVGTRYEGRSSAFAANFMPLLEERSEFAYKWMILCQAHETEGIRDAVKAYEYMNRFYIEEGNKRVSVLKFNDAVSVLANVTRIIPKKTDELENKIYFEFLDFYQLTKVNYIWFTKEGSFQKLLELTSEHPEEPWSEEDQLLFSSIYARFTSVFESLGGKKLSISSGDAFLSLIQLYGYKDLDRLAIDELKELLMKTWEEYKILKEENKIDLQMQPSEEKKTLPIIGKLIPGVHSLRTIGFIYEKTAATSSWTYAHELGRLHLEATFPGEVLTHVYDNVTAATIDAVLEEAVTDGCDIIFTTTPTFAQASVKAAIAHPEVRIMNCSLNTSHRYIRTYYARMHEAKFLSGAIAGAMSENNKIAYIADYPLFGTIAHINAFALGAKMINPRATIYLEWSTKKAADIAERLRNIQPGCISGRDMLLPKEGTRHFGLFRVNGDEVENLAMPVYHWGKFYEKMVRAIMDGSWKSDDRSDRAINYWWGMSSGIVDVICPTSLPIGTLRLIDLLKTTISSGSFQVFSGELYSQTGLVPESGDHALAPEDVMNMSWLAENVVGSIPTIDELEDQAKPAILQQGILPKGGRK